MGMSISSNLDGVNTIQALQSIYKGQAAAARQTNSTTQTQSTATQGGQILGDLSSIKTRNSRTQLQYLQQGVSMTQTASDALTQQKSAISQIKDLATKAADTKTTAADRAKYNDQAQKLVAQLNKTGEDANFQGTKLLNGSNNRVTLGPNVEQVNLTASNSKTLGVNNLDLTTAEGAKTALQSTQNAVTALEKNQSNLASQQTRLSREIEQRTPATSTTKMDIQSMLSKNPASFLAFMQGNVDQQSAMRLLTTI